jgi:tetratricopeptide (TPR) repeat protein
MTRSTRCERCDASRIRRAVAAAPAAAPAAALLLAASAALAEPAPRDPVAAETLFKEARELVKAGNDAAGCPKFEAALALNPSASIQINIAKCREREGKIASALAEYRQALVLNQETAEAERRKELTAIAQEGIRTLEPRLPKLRVVVPHPPAGARVTRDGRDVPAGALGTALPVDPGPHEVRVSAPGHRTETRAIRLEEGETETVEITLVPEKAASRDAGGAQVGGAQGGVPAWVWVTGGAGIALMGAGLYFLADDLSAISALREHCRTDAAGTRCDPGYDVDADNARKDRSFALFVGLGGAGAIATGVAVVGLVTSLSPKDPAPATGMVASPWVAPGGGGALLTGRF